MSSGAVSLVDVNEFFAADMTSDLPPAEHRETAAKMAQSLNLPDGSTEDWRYTPIDQFDLEAVKPVVARPDQVELERGEMATGSYAASVTIIDGWITNIEVASDWAEKGLTISAVQPESIDLDDSATIFDYLHQAFSPETLRIESVRSLVVSDPIVIESHHSGGPKAAFPSVEVKAGENSQLTVVERQSASEGGGITVTRLTETVADAANLGYITIQDLDDQHVQVARLRASVGAQANLVGGYVSFGGRYARVRTDVSLDGRGANGDLVGAYYGDGDQVLDFRTFQHHRARDTRSDLLFKGSLDDKSGSVYTGMINIHPEGAGSNAFQTNRNIKLSEDAWAWSVPNLEIENNDVRCSHATTVNPIDEDQEFYLQARGVPPVEADRLIVAGFFDEAINRLPNEVAREEARRLIANKLSRREK